VNEGQDATAIALLSELNEQVALMVEILDRLHQPLSREAIFDLVELPPDRRN
jgi:hypothetical protein